MKTVGELKDFIRNLPDDLLIVTSGSDHSYNLGVVANEEKAEFDPKTRTMPNMWEYWDEGNKNKKSNKVIDVLVIQ